MAKAKAEEAQLILQMYDLRREAVMRAARKYVVSELWPQNYEEFKAVSPATARSRMHIFAR